MGRRKKGENLPEITTEGGEGGVLVATLSQKFVEIFFDNF